LLPLKLDEKRDCMGEPQFENKADYSFEVSSGEAGVRLDKFLAARRPDVSRSRLQRWIELGAISVDDLPRPVDYRVKLAEVIFVQDVPAQEVTAFEAQAIDLNIAYSDTHCVVIDKPAGLVTHPAPGNWSGTLMNGLLHWRASQRHLPRAGIVHRLDKDTTGLLVAASSETALTSLSEQLAARSMTRYYLAVVAGTPPQKGRIDYPIGRDPANRLRMAVQPSGKPAVTHFDVLARSRPGQRPAALVLCKLETGRTHQIRVHLKHIGHPLLGDPVYSTDRSLPRQALHATRLVFDAAWSQSGQVITHSAMPADMQALCGQLGINTEINDDLFAR
jgi:23S rRNA pseudouridine1911/1915/1917 synthase